MATDDAARLRDSLDSRILNQSSGGDAYPLRRRVAYHRLLRRLGEDPDGGWVLKGGYLLEARLSSMARATKDLDLAMRTVGAEEEVASMLRGALEADPDDDHFVFAVARPVALAFDLHGNRAWRINVDCLLAGRTFAKLRVDLAERLEEIADATESLIIPPPIAGVAFSDARLTAVNVAQHAAEKFHALSTTYPGGRQNTRVKDLLDIVLMAEAGLLPHPAMPARIEAVFRLRDGRDPPAVLPAPPASWRADYSLLASATGTSITEIAPAFRIAAALFQCNERPIDSITTES